MIDFKFLTLTFHELTSYKNKKHFIQVSDLVIRALFLFRYIESYVWSEAERVREK